MLGAMNLDGEHVIAIMGPTGVGKSSFIHNAMPPGLPSAQVKIGHGLKSETSAVEPVSWAVEDGTRIKLVDTPGFDDSREGITDAQVLKMIATFLVKEHGEKSHLSGLIYVHRISDTRVGGTSQRNLRMFRKLCGTDSLKNVVVITTMWDKVTPEEGLKREQELMSSDSLLKPLVDGGAIMMRHERTAKSAMKIIDHLLGKSATTAQIVRELVEDKKTLEETEAGTELKDDIQSLLRRHEEEMMSLKAEIQVHIEGALEEERRKMEQNINKLLKELDELKEGIPQENRNDPPPVYEFANSFSAPDTKCIVNCSQLLRLAKAHESTLVPLYPDVLSSIASRTAQFANTVERSVKDVRYESSTLKSVLESENISMLRQLDRHPRTFTLGTWSNARHDMKIIVNEIQTIISTTHAKYKLKIWHGKGAKRSNVLNAILEPTKEVVADMDIMVKWWSRVIDTLEKVEDAAHRMKGRNDFDDSAIMIAITRITRALDSYCEAYEKCPEDLRRAAPGIF